MVKEKTKPEIQNKKGDRHFEDFREPKHIEEGGIIRISGEFLLDHEGEIINLVKHQAELAEQKNPQHKLNSLRKVNGTLVASVSDHNLTLHIGKALVHAYKGEHNYKFLKDEKFVEVDWRRD
ncbi:MAG: hypothetical protein KKA31_06215 [Candidatus Margulisbacteria bacterium]|nr:hypothetical protein [Candidatus Margulisiibacteriota bacterium]